MRLHPLAKDLVDDRPRTVGGGYVDVQFLRNGPELRFALAAELLPGILRIASNIVMRFQGGVKSISRSPTVTCIDPLIARATWLTSSSTSPIIHR